MAVGILVACLVGAGESLGAEAVDAAMQAKIDAQLKVVQAWAGDPVIVNAVKTQNAQTPPAYSAMVQPKWQELTILDPFVRSFAKNEVGQFLKAKRTDLITQAFVSDAAGLKVGYLDKTANWTHKGMPKHEVPMTGKTWQGAIELGQASGAQQIQVAVPVLDGGKPIGSLVVGLGLAKLKE